jgi:hypothetical protein
MTDYTPDGSTIMEIIRRWSKKPLVKEKERHECYDRFMKLLYGHYDDYEEWLTDPRMQKQMQMNIGYFIQDLIGNLKGHTNFREGHASGLDGENALNNKLILYEIKIDNHTTNSSSLQECINKLEKNARLYNSKPLLIQFFRTKKVSACGKYSEFLIDGNDYLNRYVSKDIGGIEGLISTMETKIAVHKLVSDAIDRICNSYPSSSTTGSFL